MTRSFQQLLFKAKNNLIVRATLIRTQAIGRIWPQIFWILRNPTLDSLVWVLATYRRSVLARATFIGVTGSCGKTMTKELIGAVLSTQFRGQTNRATRNTLREAIRTVLRVRLSDTYCVQEVSVGKYCGRLTLGHQLRLLKPKIGVVTNIGTDHLSTFGSQQGIAAEKRKLVASLPRDGIAVLNADDPFVLEMARHCVGRVVTYGTGPNAMVQGTNFSCTWPERLTFTVHVRDESHLVQTQLCGTHWVHSVLAALAVGLSLGVPLEAAVKAVEAVPPFPGRMSPEELSTGVTFIRDDWKAPILSFLPALEFIEQARALRKIVIIGTISDYSGASKGKYVQIARQALAISDYVFFVGPWSPHCLPAKKHAEDISLQAFATVDQLAEYLRAFLQPGDLVLVKGSPKDSLQSIIKLLNSRGKREDASKTQVIAPGLDKATKIAEGNRTGALPRKPLLVVGLGNPQAEYENTRHNIGQRVVEMVAARLGAHWKQEDQAMIARIEVHGRPVCLVKLLTSMNTSGPVLRQLGERLEFGAPECLLVHDDMDLPIGKVRERMRGSAGGHKGVLSIITTYQSEEFRRVKIGVGQPPDKKRAAAYALSAFSTPEEPSISDAVAEACSRVLKLLAEHGSGTSTAA